MPIADAVADLGKPDQIGKVFVSFQKHLYEPLTYDGIVGDQMDQKNLDAILGHSANVKNLCFGFFMAFSRFEFALKENGFHVKGRYGEARADWSAYRDRFERLYEPNAADRALRSAPPKQQVIDRGVLSWRDVNTDRERSELGKVILLIKTIRNNLFHGGKHGSDDWDDPNRTAFLLSNSILVLDGLADLGGITGDYERVY